MSGEALKWARGQKLGTSAMKSLVTIIAARADKTGMTWAAQATLAADSGISARHIRTLLAVLAEFGVLRRKKRSSGRNGRLSDRIELALEHTFFLSKEEVLRAFKRKSVASRRRFPTGTPLPLGIVAAERSYRKPVSGPPGSGLPTNNKEQQFPAKEEKSSQDRAVQARPRPTLTVIDGNTALTREASR